MYKKIICLMVIMVIIICVFLLCSCYKNSRRDFELSDPKEYCNATIDEDFEEDRVCVMFKKTFSYPKLKLEDFELGNAESLEYIWLRPTAQQNNSDFRQYAAIKLKEHGKEKVLEAIAQLEKLKFVKRVEPEYIFRDIDFKVGHIPSLDEDFEDNKIVIVLKHKYSIVNNEITVEHFNGILENFSIKSIKDLTYFQESMQNLLEEAFFHQTLEIEFYEMSRENILNIIVELGKLTMILSAEPLYIVENTN